MKSKSGKLSDKRLLKAARNMELTFESMVDKLEEMFFNEDEIITGVDRDREGNVVAEYRKPKYSMKEKLGVANFFARTLSMKSRVEDDLGLREKTTAQSDNPLIIALGGNVAVFKSLPAEQRQKLLLRISRGEKIESIG